MCGAGPGMWGRSYHCRERSSTHSNQSTQNHVELWKSGFDATLYVCNASAEGGWLWARNLSVGYFATSCKSINILE